MTTGTTSNAKQAASNFAAKTRSRAVERRPEFANVRGPLGPMLRQLGAPGSWRNTFIGVIFLVVLARLVLFLNFNQSTLNLCTVVFIYSIIATGMAFLYSYGGLLSIAHGALWGVGAYTVADAAQKHGMDFWVTALIAMAICGLLAALLAGLSMRVEGSYFIIILFAIAQVFYGVFENWTAVTGGTDGTVLSVQPKIFGWTLTGNANSEWYWVTLAFLVLTLLVIQAAKGSRLGQRMKAIRDNRALATSVGIDIVRTHVLAFALTGAIAGLSGVFWGYHTGYVQPDQFSANGVVEFILVILLGGSAYLLGPSVGALVLIFLPHWFRVNPLLSDALIGVFFIVIILLSPQGIAGIFERAFHWVLSKIVHQRVVDPEQLETEAAMASASEEVAHS